MDRTETVAPYPNPRSIGVVYLLYFLVALLGGFLLKGITVPGDAAATAANLIAHEARFRAGFALGILGNVLYLALTALFYWLFRPVNRSVSMAAAFFSVVGCAIQTLGGIFQLAPLVILKDAPLASSVGVEQLQRAALLSFTLYAQTYTMGLAFFACFDLLLGYLILRSTFLPRALGALLIAAGVGWLFVLWPPLATALASVILPLGGLAEVALMLWLLVKGVDAERWQEMGREPGTG